MITKMTEQITIEDKVINLLMEQLGIEKEDILPEYSFTDDLHMSPANLTDFLESLGKIGIDTSKIDMTEIETVEEFMEELESTQLIE